MGRSFRIRTVGLALALGTLATAANAETWSCRDYDRFGRAIGEPVIVATTGETDGIGSIQMDGTIRSARYEVEQSNLVWLWGGGPDGTLPYVLRIHPDGSGALFDLGVVDTDEIAHADRRFICRET
jgi:hypothetical protein